ncbi:DEHA2D14630p [Debaryomyces hansenii CBS767]|uniref:DEHA2D14630p n=1 Tax=Debaryomyces hansenii (strain ATCC 36239 / CBS 767 / BCRC 21394 / JCM 1990 / NBRC 0083 / IGC 2968) TaxID=284592 RepID=Q6BRQ4_DEBHA|nr:DEHA2D14630p [Debaryomyces hansenii CBS767]CAG87284.2 DEHA2D14630p [Debaryomyces hansenii CBS767]|eukprot:XP_459116.2 DEHA2D14630p [Debaryomyces hansenii CBS767]
MVDADRVAHHGIIRVRSSMASITTCSISLQ